jgi:hypothetical protein
MTHVHVPVIVAGEHVAMLFGAQVLLEKPTKQSFNQVCREFLKLGIETHLSPLENANLRSNVLSEKGFRRSWTPADLCRASVTVCERMATERNSR